MAPAASAALSSLPTPPQPEPPLLVELGRWLQSRHYHFVTVTPLTHQRVLARGQPHVAADERDAFGWNRPFSPALLPPALGECLLSAGLLVPAPGGLWRSTVRYSTLDGLLLSHSAYPTEAADAVFFGPDTYRFAAWIEEVLRSVPLPASARILDMGCGGGPGALVAARLALQGASAVEMVDINPRALAHAEANAVLAGVPNARTVQSDLYQQVEGVFDLIVSNPPYLVDKAARAYRHGGGALGGALSERIVQQGLERLRPGGRLVLYTGAAMVGGRDPLREALATLVQPYGWPLHYRELDPDVFGEELQTTAYAEAERIAAVGMWVQRPLP